MDPTHFEMVSADVEPDPDWIDKFIEEFERARADEPVIVHQESKE